MLFESCCKNNILLRLSKFNHREMETSFKSKSFVFGKEICEFPLNFADEYGNCKSSKVYLLIPHGEEGGEVLNGICTEMPLVRLHEWKFTWNDINSNVDRTNFKEVITRLMENAHSGKYTYSWFHERIFISRRQWSRIVKDIRDEHSLFAKKMMDAGVSYVSNGKRRGAKSYFEKLT